MKRCNYCQATTLTKSVKQVAMINGTIEVLTSIDCAICGNLVWGSSKNIGKII